MIIEKASEGQPHKGKVLAAIQLTTSGGVIQATGPRRLDDKRWWSVTMELEVPRRIDMALRTSNGGIQVSNVEGMADLRTSNGGIVMVDGEAGAGKTRLADEFLRWLVADGGTALRGRGYGGRAGVPFGPMVEILREAMNEPGIGGTEPEWLSEVARLVQELWREDEGLKALLDSLP